MCQYLETLFLSSQPGECGLPRWCQWYRRHLLVQETQVRSLGREDPLEEGMATHSRILAWRNPWTEGPGGLQSIRSQRVGHDWSNLAQNTRGLLSATGEYRPRMLQYPTMYRTAPTAKNYLVHNTKSGAVEKLLSGVSKCDSGPAEEHPWWVWNANSQAPPQTC